jgi:hypothetical protein
MIARAQDAYKYMLLFLAEKYVKDKNKTTTYTSLTEIYQEFNLNNDFSKIKTELFPFLVTIGNGKKMELLELFAPFTIYPTLGFKSLLLTTFFDNNNLFSFTDRKLNINLDDIDVINLQKYISLNDYPFNGVLKQDCQNIFKSINNINTHKIINFASLPIELISFWNKKNDTYRYYQIYFETNGEIKLENQRDKKAILQEIDFNILTEIFDIQSGVNDNVGISREDLSTHTKANYKIAEVV